MTLYSIIFYYFYDNHFKLIVELMNGSCSTMFLFIYQKWFLLQDLIEGCLKGRFERPALRMILWKNLREEHQIQNVSGLRQLVICSGLRARRLDHPKAGHVGRKDGEHLRQPVSNVTPTILKKNDSLFFL